MHKRIVERVILFIFDSFRPDYLAMYDVPNLRRLVSEGVYYGNAKGVMPSTTTTNHTSILTGAFPKHSGIPNNAKYDRKQDRIVAPLRDFKVPLLPEILAQNGLVSVEHTHFLLKDKGAISLDKGVSDFKRAFQEHNPHLMVYLDMDIDVVGHMRGPWGMREEVQRLDHEIGEMMNFLEESGMWDTTAIVIASDHLMGPGHKTGLAEDLGERLTQAGFSFALQNDDIKEETDIVVVPAGCMFLYLREGRCDHQRYAELMEVLNATPHVNILEAEEMQALNMEPYDVGDIGIFPHNGYSMYPAGGLGTHGRPGEQQITLILSGAGIREGLTCGDANSVDIVPTILHLLGIKIPATVDGVVLHEALDEA